VYTSPGSALQVPQEICSARDNFEDAESKGDSDPEAKMQCMGENKSGIDFVILLYVADEPLFAAGRRQAQKVK
jgi:hypothetical protein